MTLLEQCAKAAFEAKRDRLWSGLPLEQKAYLLLKMSAAFDVLRAAGVEVPFERDTQWKGR